MYEFVTHLPGVMIIVFGILCSLVSIGIVSIVRDTVHINPFETMVSPVPIKRLIESVAYNTVSPLSDGSPKPGVRGRIGRNTPTIQPSLRDVFQCRLCTLG